MIWMSQSAYPSFVWQTYDYYYDLTGAFWGAKKACEPIHILWNSANNNIRVVNTSSDDIQDAVATASVYSLNGKEVPGFQYSAKVNPASNSAVTCFTMQFEEDQNLAFRQPAFASSWSKEAGKAQASTDGGMGTRWGSEYSDPQWIYVDLGKVEPVNEVHLYWENAYASSYKLQVSNDANDWKDVYVNENAQGDHEIIAIKPVLCRYVRILGLKRATMWGYSLWEIKVFNKDRNKQKQNPLSDVHFIKLTLHDKEGKLLSDNFYWRGNEYLNYKALNSLSEVALNVKSTSQMIDSRQQIKAQISSPKDASNIAFAIRVMNVQASKSCRYL